MSFDVGLTLSDSESRMPSESRSGRGEPGLVGVAKPRSLRDGPGRAPQRDGLWGGDRGQRAGPPRGCVEVIKVWGRVVGLVWRLRRGPSPRESVLDRKPCQGVMARYAEMEAY